MELVSRMILIAAAAALPVVNCAHSQESRDRTELQRRGAPAPGAGYVLGPGDQLSIWALGAEELSQKPIRIDSAGFINVPMAGRIKAAGITANRLESELTERLKAQIKDPEVTVNVTEFGSQPVSVIGAVNRPGVQRLEGRRTLIEALSMAGGLSSDAGDSVRITRLAAEGPIPLPGATEDAGGRFSVAEVSVSDLIGAKKPGANIGVRAHDVISVPRSPVVYVMGEVKKPGGFAFGEHAQITVLQALALAEGLTRQSVPAKAKILRVNDDGGHRTQIPLNLKRLLAGKAADAELRPNDILFVPDSRARNFAIRAIETAVNIGSGITVWRVGLPQPAAR